MSHPANATVTVPINDPLRIEAAAEADVPQILALISELAEYENLTHEVVATADDLRRSLFGDPACAEAVLARCGEETVGFALFFRSFSTFLGKPGLYLEDLFVRPHARGKGYGRALVSHLATLAVERGCGRLEWSVLNWNRPAVRFYRRLGASPMDEWTVHRVAGDALTRLAAIASDR